MFKYIWLIMLGLLYLIELIRVSKDVMYCIIHHCLNELDNESAIFITFHLVIIFIASLVAFCV